MTPFEIFEQLESTSGKNDKYQILKTHINNKELVELFDCVFNYTRRYYMKKWNSNLIKSQDKVSHQDFISLISQLESRTITGHSALHATEEFFSRCSEEQVKWYGRVLKQDLKVGVDIDSLIKCDYSIPKFEVQLAMDGRKCKKLSQLLEKGLYASRKLDGYRCIAICIDGHCTLYSRNGTIYENFPTIKNKLEEMLPNGEWVFDGEIMSDDFNSMQRTAFAAKRKTQVGDVKYHIFDFISHKEWTTNNFTLKYTERRQELEKAFQSLQDPSFVLVTSIFVHSLEQIQELERDYIAEGYEGVICNPDICYYRGRPTNSMMKFKQFKSQDCIVIGFQIGTGRNEDRLGNLIVRQENGEVCEVGSGFTDEERTWIWANQEKVKDSILEVKYQELTPDKIMRFPVKFRWRNDK